MWKLLNIRLTNQKNKRRMTFLLRLVYGKRERLMEKNFALKLLDANPAICQTFFELMNQYTLSHRLAVPDAMIAATAKEHQIPLYTLNRKDSDISRESLCTSRINKARTNSSWLSIFRPMHPITKDVPFRWLPGRFVQL